MEGFSYLGISGIIFLLLLITNLFYKKYYTIFSNKKLLIICIPFILLATSNNINIGETNILSIPFNNIAYLIFSGIRASGRLIWPVYYLIFFVGIIFIYKYFEDDKKAFLIILTLFLIQIVDLSSGLKIYKFDKSENIVNSSKKIISGTKINTTFPPNEDSIKEIKQIINEQTK